LIVLLLFVQYKPSMSESEEDSAASPLAPDPQRRVRKADQSDFADAAYRRSVHCMGVSVNNRSRDEVNSFASRND